MNSFSLVSTKANSSIRRFFFGSFLALAMVAGSGAAYADNSAGRDARPTANKSEGRDHKGPRGKHGPRGPKDPAQVIKRFDKNGDGKLAVSELPEKARERLGKADANKDGFISADELKASAEQHKKARFAKRDKNGDGFLTRDEVGAKPWERVKVADANGDNKVSADELRAAHAAGKMKAKRPRRGERQS